MNVEIVPAAVAAGGGAALASAIYLYERRRDEAMRGSRTRLALRFPLALDPDAARAGLNGLAGLPDTTELIAEINAGSKGIGHCLAVPAAVTGSVTASLTGTMPGLRLREVAYPEGRATLTLRLFLPTPTVLGTDEPERATRALLTGLAGLRAGEHVVLRWALRPRVAPPLRQDTTDKRARYIERAWRHKTAGPGFLAQGLVLVRAGSMSRARELSQHVIRSLRSRRTAIGGFRITSERGNRSLKSEPRARRSSGWISTDELLALVGWPLGAEAVPGVEVGAARELPVPRTVPARGRRLFLGRHGDCERPVALDAESARHHVAVVGPSGVGKSVLLARGVLDDLRLGYGGAVVDPKSDLLEAIIDRVPADEAERVVVLDPATNGPVPGVNVLRGGDPDLRADVLLGALRTIFATAWGVRSEQYGRLGLRTLSEVPAATLTDIGRLFFDASFRREAIAHLSDPLLVASWQAFEAMSAAEQAAHVQAALTKVSSLIGRPRVRAILAQPEPKLDIARLLAERKWIMVSLSPGSLGEPAARLIGAALLYLIWSAIEARVSVPPEKRRPVFLYVDELGSLATLPFGFELLAERARGLGAGLTVATQTLGRLPETVRGALLGNVGTLITFRAAATEATRLTRELPGLTPLDLQSLGRFEVAARVGTGIGSGVAVMTGRTEPLPPRTGQAERIRALSAERYGVDPATLDRRRSRQIPARSVAVGGPHEASNRSSNRVGSAFGNRLHATTFWPVTGGERLPAFPLLSYLLQAARLDRLAAVGSRLERAALRE